MLQRRLNWFLSPKRCSNLMTTFGRWLRTTKQPTTRKSRSRRVNLSRFLSSLMEVHDGEFVCCWLKEWIQQKGGRLITTLNVPKNAIRERNDIRISRSPVAKVSEKNTKLETSCDVLYPSVNRATFHCLLRVRDFTLKKSPSLCLFLILFLKITSKKLTAPHSSTTMFVFAL